MSRQRIKFWSPILIATSLLTGCHPAQPFYLHHDDDLAYYLDVATDIEHPDVDTISLAETVLTKPPLTINNPNFDDIWELTLEQAVCLALQNSKVLRRLPTGGIGGFQQSLAGQPNSIGPSGELGRQPEFASTVYDPALQESSVGNRRHPGVEAALAAFDAHVGVDIFWNRRDRPRNFQNAQAVGITSFEDTRNADALFELTKKAAPGTLFGLRNRYGYLNDRVPGGFIGVPSHYTVEWEAEARHPLLRGGGTQVNRIPIVIARIRTDIELGDFEANVRDMVFDVEKAYWLLVCAYHNLEADKRGRDKVLATWKQVDALREVGQEGGDAAREALARQQYFEFDGRVKASLADLFKAENRLRYIMGLTATDGRLIRPTDDPTIAKVQFDWMEILCESLVRSVELRTQKWRIKRDELELIAARNQLLPQLDVVGLYRFVGAGNNLINADRNGLNFPQRGSTAYDVLTDGDFQEFRFGLEVDLPVGFRRELAGVRNAQLQIARDKAVLEEMELELSHSLTNAIQDLEGHHAIANSTFNRLKAAQDEVESLTERVVRGIERLDVLLDGQRRLADVRRAYNQSLCNYSLSISQVHFVKGSLLDYNGICLAEGPWTKKAYWDALGHARERDASHYMDYGFTRPSVVSRGRFPQHDPVQAEAQPPAEQVAAPLPAADEADVAP